MFLGLIHSCCGPMRQPRWPKGVVHTLGVERGRRMGKLFSLQITRRMMDKSWSVPSLQCWFAPYGQLDLHNLAP